MVATMVRCGDAQAEVPARYNRVREVQIRSDESYKVYLIAVRDRVGETASGYALQLADGTWDEWPTFVDAAWSAMGLEPTHPETIKWRAAYEKKRRSVATMKAGRAAKAAAKQKEETGDQPVEA
jgi:hypothetical protein